MSYNYLMWKRNIRRGGLQTPDGFLFELSGGHVALDFVNTVDSRPTEERRELLPVYDLLLSWSRQAGIITQSEEAMFAREAAAAKTESEKVLANAVRLREFLFDVFSAIADNRALEAEVLRKVNRLSHRVIQRYELIQTGEGFRWQMRPEVKGLDSLLWPVAHSALQLLSSPRVARIRRCAAERCDWLFLDVSKRGNRRWCDMTVCGNRAKARRHYQRVKSAV
jgi:predicted RNA-binding Zn ribbon-like protein